MKRRLREDDCVKLNKPYDGCQYGWLIDYDKESKTWSIILDSDEFVDVPEDDLTYLSPLELDEAFLKNIFTYSYDYEDISRIAPPRGNFSASEEVVFNYTLDDVIVMLKNIVSKKPSAWQFYDWANCCLEKLQSHFVPQGRAVFRPNKVFGFDLPINDSAMACCVIDEIKKSISFDKSDPLPIDIEYILKDIENFRQRLLVKRYKWTDANKIEIIKNTKEKDYKKLTEEQRQDLRRIILEMAQKEYPDALNVLGYSYYGGNVLFPCDWIRARDCFLKLIESNATTENSKCFYANTLGYIYYYGRCNNGVPEYEKAFKCFSLGAAGGVFESIYKLSDMYKHGYYVTKNYRAAKTLLSILYDENYKRITQGKFDCQFADVALRIGNLCRDNLIDEDPVYYYSVAEYALKKRLKYDSYGDAGVYLNIKKELAKIRKNNPIKKWRTIQFPGGAPSILFNLFDENSCRVNIQKAKDGLKLEIKRIPKPMKKSTEKIFEYYNTVGYCNLTDKVTLYVLCEEERNIPNAAFIADGVEVKRIKQGYKYKFLRRDEEPIVIEFSKVFRKLSQKSKAKHKKCQFVSVVFNKNGRKYDYICEIEGIKEGDKVIVLSNGEEKQVEVVEVFPVVMDDIELKAGIYKKVLRKV